MKRFILSVFLIPLILPHPAVIASSHNPTVRVPVAPAFPTHKEAQHVEWWEIFKGECFFRTMIYMLQHPDVDGRLVHGTIAPDGPLWAHAWVLLPGDKVFDAVDQRFFKKDSYYSGLKAREEVIYDRNEVISLYEKFRTPGPWHATKGEMDIWKLRRLPALPLNR